MLTNKTLNLMLDLETLGTIKGSVILSIAVVPFNLGKEVTPFYAKLDYTTQGSLGMSVDLGTMQWWMKQPDTVRDEAFSGTEDLEQALKDLAMYVVDLENSTGAERTFFWGKGADFDCVLLEHAYQLCGLVPPLGFRDYRCFRTLESVFAHISQPMLQGNKHSALDDARNQAAHAEKIFASLQADVIGGATE